MKAENTFYNILLLQQQRIHLISRVCVYNQLKIRVRHQRKWEEIMISTTVHFDSMLIFLKSKIEAYHKYLQIYLMNRKLIMFLQSIYEAN